ncbi:hypothetical protein B9Z55_028016 [Caenorhabditis nigoni]|uniref:Uncharacterized protein n=1 Tax=Caenorhabditis nigoni TaxID=1611254 RepID=A0A2G5SE12_9PELO|nr:hypothetical protein B9Z55_029094 [Caenorhabditis nigoni]PIC13172.1 hypothetical protein B9Z55_028016 [Caenorhabditis nigoni]
MIALDSVDVFQIWDTVGSAFAEQYGYEVSEDEIRQMTSLRSILYIDVLWSSSSFEFLNFRRRKLCQRKLYGMVEYDNGIFLKTHVIAGGGGNDNLVGKHHLKSLNTLRDIQILLKKSRVSCKDVRRILSLLENIRLQSIRSSSIKWINAFGWNNEAMRTTVPEQNP